ncbi:hypothetical protein AKJ49_00785 [candidate division MSBL1 archaeon SCGC-AAA382A03]|uniref:Transposase IS66 zinc-finger binding domain-containing protein n=1 Tax=candidate division MSBL1 archaeon SCGC-AAA382A03 TaxID=1698278 RepID=A0A133VG75_9EURY|nr:hypothetical protein AKJ49_00785 [candidate division MSBL1 archaeon SCGC-AAA382A03]
MTVEDEKLIHKLWRENERLCKENRDLKQENEDLREENGELKQAVQELEEAKKELEDELAEEKKPDYVQPNRKKENPEPSGRKANHKGVSREKPSHVDTVKSLNPLKTCPDCGEKVSKPQEWRERYREEIILPRYHVTKFRLPRSYCSRCDKLVEPEAGGILPQRQLGNKLRSYVVYLREELRLPVNMVRKHLLAYSTQTVELCTELAWLQKKLI